MAYPKKHHQPKRTSVIIDGPQDSLLRLLRRYLHKTDGEIFQAGIDAILDIKTKGTRLSSTVLASILISKREARDRLDEEITLLEAALKMRVGEEKVEAEQHQQAAEKIREALGANPGSYRARLPDGAAYDEAWWEAKAKVAECLVETLMNVVRRANGIVVKNETAEA